MEKIYINFIYFGFTYNKDFVRLLTGQNEFIKKNAITHVDHTLPKFTPC